MFIIYYQLRSTIYTTDDWLFDNKFVQTVTTSNTWAAITLFSLSSSFHFQSSQHNTTESEMTPTTQLSQPVGQILTGYQEHLQGIFGWNCCQIRVLDLLRQIFAKSSPAVSRVWLLLHCHCCCVVDDLAKRAQSCAIISKILCQLTQSHPLYVPNYQMIWV